MQPDSVTSVAQGKSPFLAAFAVVLAALCIFVWVRTGQIWSLLEALAFVAMAPVWYLLPISFTAPIQEQWKRRPKTFPRWALVLSVVGVVLLFSSIGLRWAA
jgi:hypothetical protein